MQAGIWATSDDHQQSILSPDKLAGGERMAVGFPSGLCPQKCLDHAENLSGALVKLSVQDANVQKRA